MKATDNQRRKNTCRPNHHNQFSASKYQRAKRVLRKRED